MSDDEADPELLELLQQSLGISTKRNDEISSDTGVLKSAEHVYNNAIDVSVDMYGTKGAAVAIYKNMAERGYSSDAWGQVELHPKAAEGFDDVGTLNFVFTMDLLNFSFWSEVSADERYQVDYRSKRWTGYNSLLACLRRALDENIPITTPRFWASTACTDETLRHVFRSATDEPLPLLDLRMAMLRDVGEELCYSFGDPDETEAISAIEPAQQSISQPMEAEPVDGPPDAFHSVAPTHHDGSTVSEQVAVSETTDIIQDFHEQHPHDIVPESSSHDASIGEPEMSQAEASGEQSLAEPAVRPEDAVAGAQAEHVTPATLVEHKSDLSIVRLIEKADKSAGKLVNLLAHHFPAFRDETRYEGRKVRFLKRAQILAADLWAAFRGERYGEFSDIDNLTMFADYRVPQMLHSLGVLVYSPPLEARIRDQQLLDPGHTWEVQLRGCSIWAVEMIRRCIMQEQAQASVNAVLIDFFLYDLAKERELAGAETIPHHRTRSPWY